MTDIENNLIRCTTREEVDTAIAVGKVPEIYGDLEVHLDIRCHILLREGSSRVFIHGDVSPWIYVYGDTSPKITTLDQSTPRIFSLDKSYPSIWVSDQSSPIIRIFGESHPSIFAGGKGSPRIDTYTQTSNSEKDVPRLFSLAGSTPTICNYGKVIPQVYREETANVQVVGEVAFLSSSEMGSSVIGSLMLQKP